MRLSATMEAPPSYSHHAILHLPRAGIDATSLSFSPQPQDAGRESFGQFYVYLAEDVPESPISQLPGTNQLEESAQLGHQTLLLKGKGVELQSSDQQSERASARENSPSSSLETLKASSTFDPGQSCVQ